MPLLKVCGSFLVRKRVATFVCLSFFAFLEVRKGKFSFLYVDIWFDVMKCKCIVKNNSFEMLVVFSPIFVADTKITFVYNFVAPLICLIILISHIAQLIFIGKFSCFRPDPHISLIYVAR